MADDALDELYWVKPEDFTAVRSRLAAAAKDRDDAAAAKHISASRKPTTAAWAVNRLALSRPAATQRLADLGDRLRAAHAAMDGEQIRELSGEQRGLIDELSRAAFEAAEVVDPSAALREDVTATLQAAIADPDVAARLGRLGKAERWSGFGEFGNTVRGGDRPTRRGEGKGRGGETGTAERNSDARRAREQHEKARATLAAAQREQSAADAALDTAKRELDAAEDAYQKARRASRAAAEQVKAAQAKLTQTRG